MSHEPSPGLYKAFSTKALPLQLENLDLRHQELRSYGPIRDAVRFTRGADRACPVSKERKALLDGGVGLGERRGPGGWQRKGVSAAARAATIMFRRWVVIAFCWRAPIARVSRRGLGVSLGSG
jgi:hypothetical protein